VKALSGTGLSSGTPIACRQFADKARSQNFTATTAHVSSFIKPYSQDNPFTGRKLQHGIREMLAGHVFTHWVTLNFHRHYTADTARRRLQLWFMNLNSKLLRSKRFDPVDTKDLFLFFAFAEHTLCDDYHFHLFVKLDPAIQSGFEDHASRIWKRMMPSGTSDIQRIKDTVDDHLWVHEYGSKFFHRAFSHEGFVTSNMLQDGRRSPALPMQEEVAA
jgi:hypothetical protein